MCACACHVRWWVLDHLLLCVFEQLRWVNDAVGWGVFAAEEIQADSFVCEYIGELREAGDQQEGGNCRVVDLAKEDKGEESATPPRRVYVMDIGGGLVIDSVHRGNIARMVNHSCEANCESRKWKVGGDKRR